MGCSNPTNNLTNVDEIACRYSSVATSIVVSDATYALQICDLTCIHHLVWRVEHKADSRVTLVNEMISKSYQTLNLENWIRLLSKLVLLLPSTMYLFYESCSYSDAHPLSRRGAVLVFLYNLCLK